MSRDRVIHSEDLPWTTEERGDLFARRRRRLAEGTDAKNLGCSMFELDPGKTAFPFHYHLANEEALYVLAGDGTLRLGTERLRVRTGDYVPFPPGSDHAHQLTNTGSEVLRYLVVSTMISPEVAVYPDSDKVGVLGTIPDGEDGERHRIATFPMKAEVGYWEGEAEGAGSGDTEHNAQAPAEEGDPIEAERKRNAAIEQGVEADLEALKRKLASEGVEPPSKPEAAPQPEPAPSEESSSASTESAIEDDLEALKRKIAAEQAGGGAKPDPERAKSSSAPGPADDLDDLKRQLDDS